MKRVNAEDFVRLGMMLNDMDRLIVDAIPRAPKLNRWQRCLKKIARLT